MATIVQDQLFSWEEVERSSELKRLRLVLENLPDEELMVALEEARGNGRDDYPIRPCFNAVIAGIVFQHPTVESLLRELRRNGELRAVCGFNVLAGAAAVPASWAMSRFVSRLVHHEGLIREMFHRLVERLGELLPDLGTHLGFDGKAVPSFSTGRVDKKSRMSSDPDAAWGVKTYRGTDASGRAWKKVTRWFGYQLHLVADVTYELPVAFELEPANASEVARLAPIVDELAAKHPAIAERCRDLVADRGLDSGRLNEHLLDEHAIRPVIDTRELWRDEKQEPGWDATREITRALDPKRVDTIVYTERGELRCICPKTGQERPMAFRGFEADRLALGYRCPAAAYGLHCRGRAQCEQGALGRSSDYGRLVRVPLQKDRRIFIPVPRDSPQWKRLYARRSAVERINSRLDNSFGFERHTIRGQTKMQARIGLALAVMLAMAVGFIQQDQPQLMRSLVGSPRLIRAA